MVGFFGRSAVVGYFFHLKAVSISAVSVLACPEMRAVNAAVNAAHT